jgi:hypothetical protein
MSRDTPDLPSFIIGGLMGIVLGIGLGSTISGCRQQSKAIEAGVGRWTVDPATGATQFEYGQDKK